MRRQWFVKPSRHYAQAPQEICGSTATRSPGPPAHPRPDRDHLARYLVPEHDGRAAERVMTAVGVHVGATDPGRPDLDHDLVVGRLRLLEVDHLDLPHAAEEHGPHGATSAASAAPFRPRIRRASAGVASSRPSSAASRATRATSCAFDVASSPSAYSS